MLGGELSIKPSDIRSYYRMEQVYDWITKRSDSHNAFEHGTMNFVVTEF